MFFVFQIVSTVILDCVVDNPFLINWIVLRILSKLFFIQCEEVIKNLIIVQLLSSYVTFNSLFNYGHLLAEWVTVKSTLSLIIFFMTISLSLHSHLWKKFKFNHWISLKMLFHELLFVTLMYTLRNLFINKS